MLIESWVQQDLNRLVNVTPLSGDFFSGDADGNLLGVKVTNNGQPVELTGTCQGCIILPDGSSFLMDGEIEGNKAWLVLPHAVYSQVGVVSVVIKVGTTTAAAFSGFVYRTMTDSIIDPEDVLPSIDELLEKLAECVAATNAANAAAQEAENVNATMSNSGGVITISVTDREGETSTATLSDQSEAVADLNSAFNSFKGNNSYTVKDNYYVDSTGAEASSGLYELYTVDVIPGKRVFGTTGNASNGTGYLAFYNSAGTLVGDPFRNDVSDVYPFNFNVVVPNGAVTLKITNRKAWNVPVTVATGDIANLIVSHENKINNLEAVANSLNSAFNSFKGNNSYTVKDNYYVDSTGAEASSGLYELYTVDVIPGKRVFGTTGNASNGTGYLAFYNSAGTLVGDPFRNDVSDVYPFNFNVVVPNGAVTLKITNRKAWNVPVTVATGDIANLIVSHENKINNLEAVANSLNDSASINFTSGTSGYVNYLGVFTAHTDYYHIDLNVNVGDKISVNTYSVSGAISVFAQKDGSTYTPLVVADTNSRKTYTYIATKKMTVTVSYLNATKSGTVSFNVDADNIERIIKDYQNNITQSQINFAEMFHRVGVIGDSLASGEIAYQSGGSNVYVDKYEYSWLSNLCRNCGTTAVHYSKGGMMAKTWLEDNGGMRTKYANDIANNQECNAYFIALGTNEIGTGATLGTISDAAGTDSFVGYMRQIIELIHTDAPNSVVFLVSTYASGSTSNTWSDMIESIAGLYSYCYYVNFIGNTDIYTTSDSPYTSLGHFTTPAYVQVGRTINDIVNKIVSDNYSDFMLFAVNN